MANGIAARLWIHRAFRRQSGASRRAIHVYGRAIRTTALRRAGKREVRRVVNSYPFTNVVR
jgi:hypothetical protein